MESADGFAKRPAPATKAILTVGGGGGGGSLFTTYLVESRQTGTEEAKGLAGR